MNAHMKRSKDIVSINVQIQRRTSGRRCRDDQRHNCHRFARLVEVLEVKRVVPNLLNRRAVKRLGTDLKLEDENHWTDKDDGVDSPTHSRNAELEEDTA